MAWRYSRNVFAKLDNMRCSALLKLAALKIPGRVNERIERLRRNDQRIAGFDFAQIQHNNALPT